MADLEAVKFVESYKLERFITDGLNNGKFGHGAVEILSEIYVLERDDVAPVVHAHWIRTYNGKWRCSGCRGRHDRPKRYCGECGARMNERMNRDG